MKNDFSRRHVLGLCALAPIALGTQAKAATHTVTIQGFQFSPANLTIAVGDTVTFTNADSAPHTASANNKSFDTERLNNGESASVTFASAGSFDYFCKFHPNMKAKISVS